VSLRNRFRVVFFAKASLDPEALYFVGDSALVQKSLAFIR